MGLIQFDKTTAGNWLGGSRSINEASPLAKNLVDGYSVGTGRPVRHRKAGFATVAGATVEASRFGPLQKLSGSSSGIQIPAVPIAGATALQVTGVVRISSQNGEMVFEQSATADSNAGFYLYGISSTELRLQVHNGASSAIFNVFSYKFPSGPVVITVRVDISANPARAELWADGKLIAAYTVTLAAGSFTSNTLNIGCRNGTSLSSDGAFGDIWVHKAWTFDAALSKWHGDLASIYKPRRIWVPVSAGGGVTHTTTGALEGAGSAIAGTAAHIAVHGTSGALSGDGASTVGSAARTREHPTSGAAAGGGGAVSGVAVHNIPHATSGALSGDGAVTAGSAARSTSAFEHATSGVLSGSGATVAGTAARVHVFSTTGALAGAGGVVAGTAAHIAVHGTSGVLSGGGGQLSGTAAGSGAAEAIGLAGGFDVDFEPSLWWQRKPKRIKPEEAKQALKAVAKVVAEKAAEHAADREPVAQRRADVKQAVAPLVAQMPGFDWRPIYDEAYDRALTAAIAQQMREQEAAQQMAEAIRKARFIDDEEVALLAAML